MVNNDDLKKYSRQAFIDNECGSDEYRETQPEKGLSFVISYLDDGGVLEAAARATICRLTSVWLRVFAEGIDASESYAGSDQLEPVLAIIHDSEWDRGSHPYGEDYRGDVSQAFKEDHPEGT